MAFSFKLIVPRERNGGTARRQLRVRGESNERIDDDPHNPVFLSEASELFQQRGVHFQIDGFFKDPLPLSVRDDLPFFLEELPNLITFVSEDGSPDCSVDLWGQGIELRYQFRKVASRPFVQVTFQSSVKREVITEAETIATEDLKAEIIGFVTDYKSALQRFLPEMIPHPWNQNLFSCVERL